MDGPESVIPPEFRRRVPDLTLQETADRNKSTLIGSLAEAEKEMKEKNLKYPILVVPQGEHANVPFHVINQDDDWEDAVKQALGESPHGKAHLISRYPTAMKSGRYESESNLK